MGTKRKSQAGNVIQSIEVTNKDGSVVAVPLTAEDNSNANKILASQVRNLIQKTIEKYNEATLTPKELKDLASAAKELADFSGEVYKSGELGTIPGEKPVDKTSEPDVSFDKLLEKPVEVKS